MALSLLALAAGLRPLDVLRFVAVVALCGVPGILLVMRLVGGPDEIKRDAVHALGIPLGLVLSVISQQILVAVGIGSFGWIIPAMCALPFIAFSAERAQREDRALQASSRDLVLLVSVTSLVLADVDWAFLIIGAILALLYFMPIRAAIALVPLAVVGTRVAIADYWYLISDDRLFEEAYARAIFNFGFWDWYGTSSTWVPYHWFAHALGGVFQATVTEESFVAVGTLPALFAATILVSSSWLIIRSQVTSPRLQIASLFAIPFLGIWLQGVSNSADVAVALGVWSLALLTVATRCQKSWLAILLASLSLSSVMLTKVSTGLVVLVGALSFIAANFWLVREREKGSARWLVPFVVAGVVFFTNYDLLHFSNVDDSRSQITLFMGGSTFSTYSSFGLRLVGAVLYAAAIGLVPLVLLTRSWFVERKNSGLVLLLVVMTGAGIAIRFLTISYNNESYLESAILCGLPIAIAFVARSLETEVTKRILVVGLLVGICVGVIQMWTKQVDAGIQETLLMKLFNSPLLILAAALLSGLVLFVVLTRFGDHSRHLLVITLVALIGLSSYSGPDLYRIGRQIQRGDIWTETGFGETDRFFFGSQDEAIAAAWLQKFSESSDLIATNHLCNVGEGCALDGQSPISAWSRLRSYVEAERFATGRRVDEILNGEQSPRGHPSWLNDRKREVFDFASDQSSLHLEALRRAGVDWFWLDLAKEGAVLTDPTLVAIQTPTVIVLNLQLSS